MCAGIILTKFVGVAMLAFSRTQIFEVYYFRMYMALVIVGSFHSLLLLPVVLSLVGPQQEEPQMPSGGEQATEAMSPPVWSCLANIGVQHSIDLTELCVVDACDSYWNHMFASRCRMDMSCADVCAPHPSANISEGCKHRL